jgi:type II secretory pathway predicted ATPase ExeA
MYRTHFGFTCHPFDKGDNGFPPEDLYVSAAVKEAEARIAHLIEMRGIGVFTGDCGSGKTTACRKATACLHTGLYRVAYVPNTTGNVLDLYKSISWEFGLPVERSRAALYRSIRDEVSRLCAEAHLRPILIIDEAHLLRSEVLEDLRLLTNYDMDSRSRLCLILIGQPQLRRRLAMAVHEAFNQRVVMRYHVSGLTRDEVSAYITHLLHRAGTELPLFEPAAVEAVFQATMGLPRKVNLLAHHALLAAALARVNAVTAEHVTTALPEVS